MAEDETATTNDVIGRRLITVGIIGAVVSGVIWFGQWNTHRESQDSFGTFAGDDAFNSAPYMVAFGVAVTVAVLGLVLRGSDR